MRKLFVRSMACLLALVLLAGFVGCAPQGTQAGVFDPQALFYTLVKEVKYASELTNAGDTTALYFPNMPAGAELVLYKGSGYYADEVVLVTLADKNDMDSAKALMRKHLTELREQFQNYQPDEVGKIDKAVLWQQGTTLILCITDDTKTAQSILEDPGNPAYTLPQQTEESTTASTDVTQPSTDVTEPSETTSPTTPTTEPTEPTQEETEPPTEPTEPEYTVPADPADKTLDLSTVHYYGDGFIRVGDRAFENHVYLENSVSAYAALINKAVKELGEDVTVYDLLIPTAIGVVLPDKAIPNYEDYVDMGESIKKTFEKIDSSVVKVNCYDNLRAHKDEYLYFRTDFHWNGPAAYYAYESFCQAKGVTPYTLAEREEYVFEGFLGRLYDGGSKKDPIIGNAKDTVYAYGPKCDVSMEITDTSGNTFSWPVIVNVDDWAAGSKYNCFAGSDNPLTVFQNKDVTDGSKCIVVKESFGNALMPFIADHYQTIYEIDYRHWDGNLAEFAKENGVTEVIFANNMSMLRNDLLIGMLGEIL